MSLTKPQNRTEMKHKPQILQLTAVWFVLFWETLWPALLPILAPLCILAIFSLFDLWQLVPITLHWIILITAFSLNFYAIWRFHDEIKWPSRDMALQRLEQDSHFRHAPLQALEDHQAMGEISLDDHTALQHQLWQRHQKDMAEQAKHTRVNAAFSTADKRDPFALRYMIVGLLILGLFASGNNWRLRLASTFQPGLAHEEIASSADMWIEPPAYTGTAPYYLLRSGQALPELGDQVDVPQGSLVIALINGSRGADLLLTNIEGEQRQAREPNDAVKPNPQDDENSPKRQSRKDQNATRLELPLEENGLVQLRLGSEQGIWPILVIEDTVPEVEFASEPATNKKFQTRIHYQFTDDYGAAKAQLAFRLDPDQDRPLDSPLFEEDTLQTVRVIELEGSAGPSGTRRFDLDLQNDPWAGLDVLLKVIVIDGAEQQGETEEVVFTLPKRDFFNPLALAVVEQRQTLAVANEEIQQVRDAFNAITFLPEQFFDDTSEYLLLRTAFWRVQNNKSDDVSDTIDHLWPLALQLEGKAVELARRRLEAAIEALRRSLENNAAKPEIDQRRADVEQAIQDYIQALAQAGISPENISEGGEQLGKNRLQEMLNAIGELSDQGANNAARQLLSDLENILENLQLSQGGGDGEGIPGESTGQSEDTSSEAGDLIGRQRDLSNRTFEENQQDGEGRETPGAQLADEQGNIADDLQSLLNKLRQQENGQQSGQPNEQTGEQGWGNGSGDSNLNRDALDDLEEALRQMQRSEGALENGALGTANEAQDQAIQSLRDGVQALEEEKATREAQNEQNGQGDGSDSEGGRDPLGRPLGNESQSVTGSGIEIPDLNDPALSRELIEELRRRLSEQGRSREEIEYLERLLDAF